MDKESLGFIVLVATYWKY